MSNMETYYKQLAESTDNINDKNMYARQAQKEAIRAFKKKRESLGTEAYMQRRIKEKEDYYKRVEAAKNNSSTDTEDKTEDSQDNKTVDAKVTKVKKKKASTKKTKTKTSDKE